MYTERRFVQGAVGVYRVRVAKSNAPFASVLLHVVTPTTTIPCDCCSSVRHLVPIVVSTVVNRSSCLLLVSRAPTNRRHPFFVSATCEREPSVPCCFRARDYCSVGVQDFLELSIHLISMRDICCCICCNGFIARFIADRNVTDDRR